MSDLGLTQHRIRSFGDLLDLVRSGNQTSLESVEFDVSVGRDHEGQPVLEIGHPVDLRNSATPPPAAGQFFTQLARLGVKQVVVDVKARRWDGKQKRAVFDEGDQDYLYTELPALLQQYLKAAGNKGVSTAVVVASVQEEFFADAPAHLEWGDGVQTRFFTRDATADPFAVAEGLGVDQIGLEAPRGDGAQQRIQKLAALRHEHGTALAVSFYTVDDSALVAGLRTAFPDAEIITNQSTIEERKLRLQPELKRR